MRGTDVKSPSSGAMPALEILQGILPMQPHVHHPVSPQPAIAAATARTLQAHLAALGGGDVGQDDGHREGGSLRPPQCWVLWRTEAHAAAAASTAADVPAGVAVGAVVTAAAVGRLGFAAIFVEPGRARCSAVVAAAAGRLCDCRGCDSAWRPAALVFVVACKAIPPFQGGALRSHVQLWQNPGRSQLGIEDP